MGYDPHSRNPVVRNTRRSVRLAIAPDGIKFFLTSVPISDRCRIRSVEDESTIYEIHHHGSSTHLKISEASPFRTTTSQNLPSSRQQEDQLHDPAIPQPHPLPPPPPPLPATTRMRILLLGASGRTGALTLAEALSRSHTVTALVRRPSALTPHPALSIITGTPLSASDVAAAFDSAPLSDPIRAVICTLNAGRTSDNPWAKPTAPGGFLADCTRNCLVAMRERKVGKMVVLGTNGVGGSRANSGWVFNWVVDRSNLRITFDDHFAVQGLLEEEGKREEGFRWVSVRATGLSGGGKKKVREFGNEGKGVGWFVSRASVAGFLLDAVEEARWDGQTPVISN